jgi:hypothetical protein
MPADQFDPTNPIATAGAGGLSAAAPPAGPPPGVVPRPALSESVGPLGFSMNPEAMMRALQMSTVPDEDIRRLKFLSGMGAPTRSGNWGESLSNANAAYADAAQKQKEMMAQYAPMMMQHMVQMQGNLITQQQNLSKMSDQWGSVMDSAAGGLLLTKPQAITPGMIAHTIFSAGNAHGVPATEQYKYYADIMAQDNPVEAIKGKVFGHLDSKTLTDIGFPEYKPTTENGVTVWTAPGHAGINAPQIAGSVVAGPQGLPDKPVIKEDKEGGQMITYKGQTFGANTPQGRAMWDQWTQDVQHATSAFKAQFSQPGAQASPPAPGQMPSQAVPAAPAAGATPPMASIPPAQAKHQALQAGLSNPAVSTPSLPGGANPINPATGFTKGEEALGVGQPGIMKFDDIPQLPANYQAGANPGSIDPTKQAFYADSWKNFANDTKSLSQVAGSQQEALRRAAVIQDLTQRVRTGATAGLREDASALLSDIGKGIGLNPSTVDSLSNRLAGGGQDAVAALQTLQKLAVSGAMVTLKGDLGSASGQRVAMQEFVRYLNAVANPNLDPRTIANLRQNAIKDYQRTRTEMDARSQFTPSNNADPTKFDSWWAAKQDQMKYVPTDVNMAGGRDSGDPFSNFTFGREMRAGPNQGRVTVQDPKSGKSFYVDQKFLSAYGVK